MNNLANQKSGLAKLMATENITVQHAKRQTACFDPKNRILTCPIWEQMSGDLYDLLMGHEVGHAIDTPAEGWHDVVHNRGGNYKAFLNVVEDARIEKRQKRRYPGLRRSFVNGFNELMKRDFFGIKGRDVNAFPFIDRLNLYTKSSCSMEIEFNDQEQKFIDRVLACETFEDVLKLTDEIWEYSKEEQSQMELPDHDEFEIEMEFEFDEDGDYESGESDGDSEIESNKTNPSKRKQKSEDEEDGAEDESGQTKPESKQSGDEDGNPGDFINRKKDTNSTSEDFQPRCETDDNFRNNETLLIDKKAREYVYLNIPKADLSKIITPAKRVQEILTNEFMQQDSNYMSYANNLYDDFRRKNERFISLLAKEFEMRKAAEKFSKAKTADTGDIDVSRIFKYQIDDAIFKKVMRIPKGKSHGLILLLDKSGSMAENLSSSYEQILILALFCRKVNIPFAAYGFGNNDGVRMIDYPNESRMNIKPGDSNGCFSDQPGDMWLSSVYLREMVNSRMSNSEFSKAVKNILCLMQTYKRKYGGPTAFYRPGSDSLSNTPLTEALVASQSLINEFRKVNNLEIVNLCIVHDGDADDISAFHTPTGRNYFRPEFMNVVLCDKKNKLQEEVRSTDESIRISIANWLSKTTGVKIVGFYLAPDHSLSAALRRRYVNKNLKELQKDSRMNYYEISEIYKNSMKALRKEKFLESDNPGYESFFIIPGGNETVSDDELEAPEKITVASMAKAFSKFSKSRQVNRILVSRFIGIISK